MIEEDELGVNLFRSIISAESTMWSINGCPSGYTLSIGIGDGRASRGTRGGGV